MEEPEKIPVVAIVDVETTGADPERDRVIEFAVQKGFEPGAYRQSWRVNPGIPIPLSATAVHGITNEDVKDAPLFSALMPVIRKILTGSDVIVGYNVEFDLRAIAAEFQRAGAELPDLHFKIVIDPLRIWRHFEPRKLSDAVRRFAGEEHTAAHTATGDVEATGKVLLGMLKQFGIAELSWEEIANILQPGRASWVGSSSHLRWKDGTVIFNFGKYTGQPVQEVLQATSDYLDWIISTDFPPHVKEILKTAYDMPREEFHKWIIERYTIII